jgi:ABC-type multidrug transport system fused ATPase/permease subunit
MKKYLSGVGWAFKQIWVIDKKNFLFWTIISIAGSLLPAYFVFLTKDIVNSIQKQINEGPDSSKMVSMVILLAVVMLVKFMYGLIPSIMLQTMRTKYAVGMQKKLAELVRAVPLQHFDNPDTAT